MLFSVFKLTRVMSCVEVLSGCLVALGTLVGVAVESAQLKSGLSLLPFRHPVPADPCWEVL